MNEFAVCHDDVFSARQKYRRRSEFASITNPKFVHVTLNHSGEW